MRAPLGAARLGAWLYLASFLAVTAAFTLHCSSFSDDGAVGAADDAGGDATEKPDAPNLDTCIQNPTAPECLDDAVALFVSGPRCSRRLPSALFVGGAALFVASGPGRSEPTRRMRVVPVASSRGGGLSLVGRF